MQQHEPGSSGKDHGSFQGSGGNGSPQSSSSGNPDNKHLDDINPVDDGPTADKKPGLGIEFESSGVIFSNRDCDEDGTFALKGELIQGRDHQTYTSKKKHGGDSTTTPNDSSRGGKTHPKRGSSRPGSRHGSPQGSRSSSPQRGPSTSPKGKDSTSQHHSQKMDDWKLTGDTTQSRPGSLTGEYILNGKTIKLGTKRAGAAAKEVHEDFTGWDVKKGDKVTIPAAKTKQCREWTVDKPSGSFMKPHTMWQYQATAPLPLAAVNEVIYMARTGEKNALLSDRQQGSKKAFVWVNKDFFQAIPEGNRPEDVSEDAMGFLSLVLSYAKNAESRVDTSASPKTLISIMPRTDFASLHQDVSGSLKGDLYKLVSLLACYKNGDEKEVVFDNDFCDGDLKNPKPKEGMDKKTLMTFKGTDPKSQKGDTKKVDLKGWMEMLPKGKDLLAEADGLIDKQIGGLGSAREELIGNPKRLIPLFEFRDMGAVASKDFEKTVNDIEDTLVALHKKYK